MNTLRIKNLLALLATALLAILLGVFAQAQTTHYAEIPLTIMPDANWVKVSYSCTQNREITYVFQPIDATNTIDVVVDFDNGKQYRQINVDIVMVRLSPNRVVGIMTQHINGEFQYSYYPDFRYIAITDHRRGKYSEVIATKNAKIFHNPKKEKDGR